MKKAYIATTLSNLERQQQIAKLIYDELGIGLSYDWTTYGAMTPDHLAEDIPVLAEKEEDGVRYADLFILILPSAKGSQTELGIAIGLHKTIIVLVENEEDLISKDGRFCVFHHRRANTIVRSEAELLAYLRGWLDGLAKKKGQGY